MSITEFLLARIAEDEEVARLVEAQQDPHPQPVSDGYQWDEEYDRLDVPPARVLAECQAKRDIIAEYPMRPRHVYEQTFAQVEATEVFAGWDIPRALLILAAVYADHPDYDKSWRA